MIIDRRLAAIFLFTRQPRAVIVVASRLTLIVSGCLLVGASSLSVAQNAPAPTVVRQAVRAMLGGPGQCIDPPNIRETQSAFFGSVRLYRGSCLSEHGDTVVALAALDSLGNTYLLDSPSSWRFLTAMHTPNVTRLDHPRAYAAIALEMQGEFRDGPSIFGTGSPPLLDPKCAAVGRTATGENDRQIGGKQIVRLLATGKRRSTIYKVIINSDGSTFYTQDDCRRDLGVH
jgi:hypothetical protein